MAGWCQHHFAYNIEISQLLIPWAAAAGHNTVVCHVIKTSHSRTIFKDLCTETVQSCKHCNVFLRGCVYETACSLYYDFKGWNVNLQHSRKKKKEKALQSIKQRTCDLIRASSDGSKYCIRLSYNRGISSISAAFWALNSCSACWRASLLCNNWRLLFASLVCPSVHHYTFVSFYNTNFHIMTEACICIDALYWSHTNYTVKPQIYIQAKGVVEAGRRKKAKLLHITQLFQLLLLLVYFRFFFCY